MEKKLIILGFFVIMFFLSVGLVNAVDYYVNGSNGNNVNNGLDWSNAFETIGEGIRRMAGEDTLIIADGIYDATQDNLIRNVPNGTSNQYTTIMAQNDHKAIIDGMLLSSGGTVSLSDGSYIQLVGIGSRDTPHTAMFTQDAHHIKIFNCSVADAGGAAVGFGTNVEYGLVEGCFAWGNSRYTYHVSSAPGCQPPEFPGDSRFNCSRKIVFRNNAARWDYTTVDEPPGSFTNYLQTDIYFFNNIAFDGTGLAFNDWIEWETIGNLYRIHSNPIAFITASGHDNTEFRGNIALNYQGFGFVMSGESPYMSRNVKFEDNILWDISPSPHAEICGYDNYLGRSIYVANEEIGPDAHIYNHNTFGNIQSHKGHFIYSYQNYNLEQSTSKNSIYYNVTLDPNQAALDAMKSRFNVFYGNSQDYDLCSGMLCTNIDGSDHSSYFGTEVDPIGSFSSIVEVSDIGGILDPADDGRERGAEVLKMIGQPGTLYGESGWNDTTNIDLWPWRNEEIMKDYMCNWSKWITWDNNGSSLHFVEGNRGFCNSPSFSDYVLNYLQGQDLQTCSELGGNICEGSQGCDGTNVPSSNGQCCLGTCRDCVLSNSYWSDVDGNNIEGTEVLEGTSIYQNLDVSYCGGKTINLEIWEDDILSEGEPFDEFVSSISISIPSNIYNISQEWISQWMGDIFGNPEYYFKAELVDDPTIFINSGLINVDQDTSPPVISDVNVNSNPGSADIIWTTDKPSDSTVNYGLTIAYGSSADSQEYVTSHSISLTNLDSGTLYYYQIISCTSGGFCSTPYTGSFTTSEIADATLDFSFLEDTKISSSGPNNNWGSKTSLNINDDNFYVLMRWNLLDYQGQNLDSAILRVYNFDTNTLGQLATLSIYPFMNNLWTEGTGSGVLATDGATWNEWNFTSDTAPVNTWNGYPNGPNELDYSLAGMANPQAIKTDTNYMDFDITSLVQQLLDGTYNYDNGFIIKSDTYLNIRSSESSNNPPELVLNFAGGVPPCQLDSDCDDLLSCTLDVCNAGTCENNLDVNSCLISSVCYADGASNPQQTCAVCNVDYSQSNWDTSGCGTDLIYLDSGQWTFHQDVASNGNTIFTSMPNGIQSWDVSNINSPGFLDDYYFSGEQAYSIDEQSSVLGVTTSGGSLYLFDVSTPSSIVYSSVTSGLGANPYVLLYDDGGLWAYTAGDSSFDFKIWDLSNLANPSLRGSVNLNKGKSLAISGTNAFVVTNDGLSSIDISNIDSPQILNDLILAGNTERVSTGQSRAYVSARNDGIHIVDISNPNTLSLVNTFVLNVGDGNGNLEVKDIFVSGTNLYVITDLTGLVVYDISNPDSPSLLGFESGAWSDFDWMDLYGDRVYATHWDGTNPGILIHDVSVPSSPSYVSRTGGYDYVRYIDSDSGYVYGATGGQGVFVHDHSDSNNLVEMGNLPIFESWGVKSVGNLVYIASTTHGLVIGNFTNPSMPSELGSVSVGQARAVDVVGTVAYVGAFSQGFATVDVTDSNNPFILDQEVLPSMETIALDVSGSLVATADSSIGVNFWDVTDPNNVLLLGNYPTTNFALDVDIYGSYAYIAENNNGLHIVNISDSANPTQSGFLSMSSIESFDIFGSYLYVALYGGGVSAYSLNNPIFPSFISNYNTPGGAVAVSVENDKVYVADRSSLVALQFGESVPLSCIDGDGDGYGICPNCGIANGCAYDGNDCDDTNINIWQYLIGYADGDSDLYYSMISQQVCSGNTLPTDYSAIIGDDCNDTNSLVNPGMLEACNGVNDDCDVLTDDGTDEDWYNNVTECGVGECYSTGNLVCQEGVQVNTCINGTSEIEICDNLDNNCNGIPDDNIDPVSCGEGLCIGQSTCSFGNWSDCSTNGTNPMDCILCDEFGNENILNSYCYIDSLCYSDGENNTANECETCNSSSSQSDWNIGNCECSINMDCGIDSTDNWSDPYCIDNNVYHNRTLTNYICISGFCDTNYTIEDELVDSCIEDNICEGGECISLMNEFRISLEPGWNYISISVDMNDTSSDQIGDIILNYDAINNMWLMNMGPLNQISNLEPLEGYVVYSDLSQEVSFYGLNITTPLILSSSSWNLAGVYDYGVISDFYTASENYSVYQYISDDVLINVTDSVLEPGVAYWMDTTGLLSQPKEIVGNQSNITRAILPLKIPSLTGNLDEEPINSVIESESKPDNPSEDKPLPEKNKETDMKDIQGLHALEMSKNHSFWNNLRRILFS
jgi:hypothetical protein